VLECVATAESIYLARYEDGGYPASRTVDGWRTGGMRVVNEPLPSFLFS